MIDEDDIHENEGLEDYGVLEEYVLVPVEIVEEREDYLKIRFKQVFVYANKDDEEDRIFVDEPRLSEEHGFFRSDICDTYGNIELQEKFGLKARDRDFNSLKMRDFRSMIKEASNGTFNINRIVN